MVKKPKSLEKTIQGVRYALRGGRYYFSLANIARKFGYKSANEAEALCRDLDSAVSLSNGEKAVDFEDFLLLSKAAPDLPDDFIEALQKEVLQNRESVNSAKAPGHPDFSNPAEAARAWAELYEQSENLRKELADSLEKLGDGREYKIVNAIPWLRDYFQPLKVVPMIIGSYLHRASKKEGKPVKKCLAFGYRTGTSIGMYSVEVIDKLREKLDREPDYLASYRKRKGA